jgi:hypothetical protein
MTNIYATKEVEGGEHKRKVMWAQLIVVKIKVFVGVLIFMVVEKADTKLRIVQVPRPLLHFCHCKNYDTL